MNTMTDSLDHAILHMPEGPRGADHHPWKAHPAFAGVWMRHLILGEDSQGRYSCHHVRLEPGCAIGTHVHDGSVEVHEVLAGEGVCGLNGADHAYRPGVRLLVPAGDEHTVQAGPEGLLLVAHFAPALL